MRFLFLVLTLATFIACTKSGTGTSSSSPEEKTQALAARGRQVYLGNCVACHNSDPTKDGTVGPAIAGSSLELIEARIVNATYPAGYKPKRDTKLMAALPHLKSEVEALHAYLAKP